MLVPSMSLEEMKWEIQKDQKTTFNKVIYHSNKLIRHNRRYKVTNFDHLFEYTSVQKNTWLYRFSKTADEKVMSIATLVYFYGRKGLIAFTYDIERDTLHFHTAHFFKRYNERLKLGLVYPLDILKHYILHTSHISYNRQPPELAPGIYNIFGAGQKGVVLGQVHERLKILRFNTFLTYDMLGNDQHKREFYLKSQFSKYFPDFVGHE